MPIEAFKLLLSPLLIVAATLAARRWGPAVGGWLVGLPLTSGPISVFLALEQGPAFAAHTAIATLLGLTAANAFCVAYVRVSSRTGWLVALVAASLTFACTAAVLSFVPLHLSWAVVMACGSSWLSLRWMGLPGAHAPALAPPWWDLPLRMAVALAVVWGITLMAHVLGPHWSGMISPFPVFASILAVFAHVHAGRAAAHRVLRSVTIGVYGFTGFFVAVALLLGRVPLPWVYLAGIATALGVNGVLWLMHRHRSGRQLPGTGAGAGERLVE